MSLATYLCPDCGETIAADRPLWRCACGGHLNLAPGPGMARGEIVGRRRVAVALPRGLGARPAAARVTGRGLDAARHPRLGRSHDPLQARKPDADRLVQGPRHGGDAEPPAGGRGRADPRGFVGQCRLVDRDLRRRRRHPVPHLHPGHRAARQDRADRRRRAPRSWPIPGTRQAVTDAALAAAGASFYASHNWQPFFIEGTQTLAFEIWEQLGFAVPDNILVPTGYGSNILGLERGFDELTRRGEITRMPRLFAVQAANCAAFAAAWKAGRRRAFTPQPTIADGIATVKPVRTAEVLRRCAARAAGSSRCRKPRSRRR